MKKIKLVSVFWLIVCTAVVSTAITSGVNHKEIEDVRNEINAKNEVLEKLYEDAKILEADLYENFEVRSITALNMLESYRSNDITIEELSSFYIEEYNVVLKEDLSDAYNYLHSVIEICE